MTGSSGAASDPQPVVASTTAADVISGGWRRAAARFPLEPAVLALVVGAMTAIMFASHRTGHWWGDDWALYIRQGQSLLDGNPGEVYEQNRFAVDESLGAPFSPPLYPWGFPALLAPAIAVVGTDVDRLVIVPVLSSVVFACCWYAIARRRLAAVPAMVSVLAVTATPLLLGWTELIQSEWPFLAVTGVMLVAIDRTVESGILVADTDRLWPLIGLGLGATAAFTVRREGLAMTAAVAAAQLTSLGAAGIVPWRLERPAMRRLAVRLLLPHSVALAAVGLVHLVLPTTLVPRYSGTGIANIWRFADHHVEHLAEVSGLKRPWDDAPHVFGNTALGWSVVVAYYAFAACGIALALTRNRHRDLHLLVYAAAAFVIGGSFRVAINRYVTTVAPILLLFGLIALTALVGLTGRARVTAGVATIAVAAIVAGNLHDARERIDRAQRHEDAGAIEWGATHPAAIEMFATVESLTGPDDIVAAPKARVMTLETDRLAVQVDDYRPLPTDLDLALIVAERDADLTTELLEQPNTYQPVWQNTRFVVFRPLR